MRAAIIKRIERSEDRASTVERIQIWSGALTWGKKSEDSSDEIVEHQLSSYITIEETEAELYDFMIFSSLCFDILDSKIYEYH